MGHKDDAQLIRFLRCKCLFMYVDSCLLKWCEVTKASPQSIYFDF